ncbi:hypothetical protein FQN54_004995 [Arachnomyces sp. PD_36]|nr:hypothetical protein FQN54_004995 [Arachnomyces sp. PD_36]
MVLDEREEWKTLAGSAQKQAIVKPKEVEEIPYVEHLRVSGITQNGACNDVDPVPRDPQKARIGYTRKSNSRDFAQFQLVDMLNPEEGNDRNRQIGYMVHAACWVLLDRVIGHSLVEANLRIFLNALKQFWKENSTLWRYIPPDPCCSRLVIEEQQVGEHGQVKRCLEKAADVWENPLVVPEIRSLIDQAVRGHSKKGNHPPQLQQPAIFDIPLEIAIMIVNTIYDDVDFGQANIDDMRNMLMAFRWTLPDSYWQSRCKKDLIFEYEDLMNSDNQLVDWQLICLGTEELFLKDGWYEKGGLKNRHRTLSLLQGIRAVFLEKIEQQKSF